MSEIKVRENETLESALKRFKRKCANAGVLSEVRKREHYEKPSVKRKKKSEAARKRKFKLYSFLVLLKINYKNSVGILQNIPLINLLRY